ncbi:MAG TPA: hypothetical protein VFS07_09225, partial [Gemmatimonadales bacterium]|nr:hypothetical protein [Gemmatimonadales bacterium]
MTGAGRGARLAAAAGIAAFAFLPIANWIPGGHAAPFYASVVAEWWSGGLLVVGIGALLALASRRVPALWRPGLWRRA